METINTLTVHSVDNSAESEFIKTARKSVSAKRRYTSENDDVCYSDKEKTIAVNLAVNSFSKLSYQPIASKDESWESDTLSHVSRYKLDDGSFGYFKPFSVNSWDEHAFRDYGTSSLGASISEVNAYRLAKVMGKGFDDLVPETVMREIDGMLGTLQREVKSDQRLAVKYAENEQLQKDYRHASIFDFVVGNLDRHHGNFLYGYDTEGSKRNVRIRLIDNSFTFPDHACGFYLNESVFANFESPTRYGKRTDSGLSKNLNLSSEETTSLIAAKKALQEWMENETIGLRRGKAAIRRIDYVLSKGEMQSFVKYYRQVRAPRIY